MKEPVKIKRWIAKEGDQAGFRSCKEVTCGSAGKLQASALLKGDQAQQGVITGKLELATAQRLAGGHDHVNRHGAAGRCGGRIAYARLSLAQFAYLQCQLRRGVVLLQVFVEQHHVGGCAKHFVG